MKKKFFIRLTLWMLFLFSINAGNITYGSNRTAAIFLPQSFNHITKGITKTSGSDSAILVWDNDHPVAYHSALNPGDVEALMFTAEHPCSLSQVQFHVVNSGAVRVFIWDDFSNQPNLYSSRAGPVTFNSSGAGWHTFDLEAELGHKVYIPPKSNFHVGRMLGASDEPPTAYTDNSIPAYSSVYNSTRNEWYVVGIDEGGTFTYYPFMIRAKGIYFNKDTIKQFTNVAGSSELPTIGFSSTIAIADYDNDGFDDVVCTNALYHNEGDGTFSSTGIFFGAGHTSWGDFNDDGLLDAVTAVYPLQLWRNNGDGTFTDVAESMGFVDYDEPKKCAGFGDINGDGWLDLYVAYGEHYETNFVFHSDHIYLNQAGTSFVEVTDSFAPDIETKRYSRALSFCDFDNDGDQDIYVGCYRLARNFLLINDGTGHFTDEAGEYGVEGHYVAGGYGHTIGSKWCDFDNDGDFDLIVTNLAHPTLLAYSDKTYIYRNNGDGTFTDIFDSSGVEYYETHSCPAIGDYDNDGNLDLYITSTYWGYHSWLYKGNGDGTFTDDNYGSGVWTDDGWGAGWTDYDNDGDLDLLVSGHDGIELYRNEHCPTSNNWVKLNLIGDEHTNNYFAYGAQARLYLPDGRILSRCIQGNTGTEGGMDSRTMHFGTGDVTTADSLVVFWPADDAREVLPDFAIDEEVDTIYESNAVSKIRGRSYPRNQGTLKVAPNPFSSTCRIEATGQVELFDISGKKVALFKDAQNRINSYVWKGLTDNGAKLPNGVYLIYEESSGAVEKVMLLK